MKTPFLWAGSKDRDYKTFKHLIPEFSKYYEPFCGGAAVYFRLLAARGSFAATLADVNADLIATFEVIRDDAPKLIAGLPADKDKTLFNSLLKSTPSDKVERAIRFLYCNRNRFFGLGGWMVADRYARGAVIERIELFSPLMQQTSFVPTCWEVDLADPDGFVFCDPPYPETNNDACYKLADREIMTLNEDYLKKVVASPCNFIWITKFSERMEVLAHTLPGVTVAKRAWTFRRPQQAVQTNHELYVHRDATALIQLRA